MHTRIPVPCEERIGLVRKDLLAVRACVACVCVCVCVCACVRSGRGVFQYPWAAWAIPDDELIHYKQSVMKTAQRIIKVTHTCMIETPTCSHIPQAMQAQLYIQ